MATDTGAPENIRWRLIVGLGNPGRSYVGNRHNVGFMLLDKIAAKHHAKFNKVLNKGIAAIGEGDLNRVVLLKPQTFMNDSGVCVAPTAKFYKCSPADVLIVYDELDLPFGQLRLRAAGGAAGHNGMRSIITHLGTQAFPRLRIGVGRPPGKMAGADYLLQNFAKSEQATLDSSIFEATIVGLSVWLTHGIEAAMNKINITIA